MVRRQDHSRVRGRAGAAWLRAALALALVVALATAITAPRAGAQPADKPVPLMVRVVARGTTSGSVEFAIRQLAPDRSWGELQYGRARFMTPPLIARQQWVYASPVTLRGGREVRVAARGTASGSVEFAVQAREADRPWGQLLLGRSRFMTPRLIALQEWRDASPVVIREATDPPPTARPPTPRPRAATPATSLPCEHCRADPASLWINFTDGDGVAARDDCLDSARTGFAGLPEGTHVARIASGTDRCSGWSYVTWAGRATWVRHRYLSDTPAPAPYLEWWHPPLPLRFCVSPLDPSLGADFSAEELRRAVQEAMATWNAALQDAEHERSLSGPALETLGDCEDGELRPFRSEIAVRPLRTASGTITIYTAEPERFRAHEVDIRIAPKSCSLGTTVAHELGHALGLGHGGQPGDLMYYAHGDCASVIEPNAVEVAMILEGRAGGD
ncbi:MAG: matrixin family metalloprotease [Chloroflexi bacterium]|nr:matrixin family metalloprotease [Chloroflexota bacterium]